MVNYTRISITVPPELAKQYAALGRRTERGRSGEIRRAMRLYLAHEAARRKARRRAAA
jgi:metal-responsive CopG/Arc/MetJ family transcriptional regulator